MIVRDVDIGARDERLERWSRGVPLICLLPEIWKYGALRGAKVYDNVGISK